MKDKGKSQLILTIGIALLVITLLGISYSFFLANISGRESTSTVSASSGVMEINYIPTNASGTTIAVADNYIYAALISPSPSAFVTKYFKVKGTNTTSKTMAYNITLVIDENTFSDNSLYYIFNGTNTSSNGVSVPSIETKTAIAGTTTITIGTGNFTTGSDLYHTYSIKFYFPDTDTDQSEDMAKSFKAHIVVNSIQAS